MSHAHQGGQAPDQASSGRQTGAAVPRGPIIRKARNAASHPTSHTRHDDNQAGDGLRRTDPNESHSPPSGGTARSSQRAGGGASHW
jgi:hypothetical protein